MKKRGNCYYASEALYHILGGKKTGWKAMYVRLVGGTHWFLRHQSGLIIDPSRLQFGKYLPDYQQGVGSGFLTKRPSSRAEQLMETLTWQS